MPTQVFHFKHFDVVNERSAMKVNTDGVLLGAWASHLVGDDLISEAWDIGCGTGVIALILAWRLKDAHIDAVELDSPSAAEARLNFFNSPWPTRLTLAEGDFMNVCDSLPGPDLIVCNPPFFNIEKQHNLVSPDNRKAAARHEQRLTYSSLLALAGRCLTPAGTLCCISPADREDDIEFAAQTARMHVCKKAYVSTTPSKKPVRILWQFGREASAVNCSSLSISDGKGGSTSQYIELVKDLYINF